MFLEASGVIPVLSNLKNKEAESWKGKSFPIYDKLTYIFGKDRVTGKVVGVPSEMIEEQSQNEVDASGVGAENDGSPVNQQSSQSESSQRKRKKVNGNSNDGTDAIASAKKELFAESGKRMQLVTDAIQGKEDHTDIAKELKEMGLSPLDQIIVLTLILEKSHNVM